jgi:hypothetical protein
MKHFLVLLVLAAGLAGGALPAADAFRPQPGPQLDRHAQQAQTVTFAAAGDHSANNSTAASLAALDQSGSSFYLALGDMDYNHIESDAAWCEYIKAGLPALGPEFPFELVAGNHEDDDGPDGYIMNHAACLPDRTGSSGVYAAEYYFDYPSSSPLVRVIMISPDLTVEGITYEYTVGSPDYNWLSSAIDGARIADIPWVVVGMHKVCISTGNKSCEIGAPLLNLLLQKRVDVVLQAHDHNYQRSKQLGLSAGCPAISVGSYDSNCVVDEGSPIIAKGAGTTIVIAGVFGMCCTGTSPLDPEAGYFEVIDSTSDGFTKFTLDAEQLQADFVPSTGTFTDSFTIVGASGDTDGDGFSNNTEAYLGTNPTDSCGDLHSAGWSRSWPADLSAAGGIPDSTNKVTINDLTSFIAPVRRVNTSPGDLGYDPRWDISPGSSNFSTMINIQDMIQLLIVAPPMLGSVRAFDGPACAG